jgi:luciferase family oxidoreductase group 1
MTDATATSSSHPDLTSGGRPPLSVLDLAIVTKGGTSAEALARSTALAQRAEALGYHRFWVAEHHNMAAVASTTPPVLMTHLAANTETIRIGSGGIMLPNHAPLVVAEQIAALEALYPDRIDLGLGRAPGSDQATAAALRRSVDLLGADDFPRDLLDLMGLLGDVRGEGGLWEHFTATPAAVTAPQIVLLGSSGYSAQLAGVLGLRFAFAHHFDSGGTLPALELYRRRFAASPVLDEPYVIVTANVFVAPTDEEAEYQSAPGRLMVHGIRTGRFEPLCSPEEAQADPNLPAALAMPSQRIQGSPETVIAELDALVTATGADEIMVSSVAYDLDVRLQSLELLADAWAAPRS